MPNTAIDLGTALGPFAEPGHGFSSPEIAELAEAILRRPPRAVRLHPRIGAPPPFEVLPVDWFSAGRLLADPQCLPGAYVHHAAGDFYIQDAGSMLPLALCQVRPGEIVADVCAAPGGKSTGLSEMLGDRGLLVANEVISSRFTILQRNIERCGFGNTVLTNSDVEVLAECLPHLFDCVLVDAPCTGQSMLSKGKQSKSAYSAKQIQHSAARQLRILKAAAGLVKPGGRLVYSTCSFSFAENEGVIESFLKSSPSWAMAAANELANWQSPFLEAAYRLWPHRDPSAGVFAARLVLNDTETLPLAERAHSSASNAKTSLLRGQLANKSRPKISGCEVLRENHQLFDLGSSLDLLPDSSLDLLRDGEARGQLNRIRLRGTEVAELKGKTWQPAYGGSRLPKTLLKAERELVISDEQAKQYIQGQSIRCDSSSSGWCRVIWRDRPLSWGKLSDGQCKNHFPKVFRQNAARV